jgi:GTPase SAR1 family protein
MHPAYYHQAHACIMCFDVTRKQTYKNLPAWYKELRDYRAGIPVRHRRPACRDYPAGRPRIYFS